MSWLDRLLCPLSALAEQYGGVAVILVLTGVAVGGVVGSGVVRWLSRVLRLGGGSLAIGWAGSSLLALAVYLVAILVDPLLKSTLERPASVSAPAWSRVGFFEYELLGDWAWPFLPLSEHPATGIVLHLAAWLPIIALIRAGLAFYYRDTPITWRTPTARLPFTYRWVGSSTARRADQRFTRWAWRLVWVAWPTLLLSGFLYANESRRAAATHAIPQCVASAEAWLSGAGGLRELTAYPIAGAPPVGAWVLGAVFLFAFTVHLLLEGSPPPEREEAKELEDEELPGPPPDPLRRLGDALQARLPGAFLEALEQHAGREAERAGFHPDESPLLAEALASLTGAEDGLFAHQREVLDHLRAVWKMSAPTASGPAPELREEVGPSPIVAADLSTPHALVLAPEGSGRTTLAMLSALYVHLDRGATSLVVVRDQEAARAWSRQLREALSRGSARWNVSVVCAGEDLAETFLAGRTPAVVVAGLEALEADVLGFNRTDPFFASLGLIVVDDADRMTGVAEMHAHMIMRRVWTLLDTLHDAPYPPVLLGVVGPSASGMDAWARHVLAAPMRVFDGDGAPRVTRAILRRRDLADAHGEAIPLHVIAEACEEAQVPWHIRWAGDANRHSRRFATELGRLRRHHKADPLDAEVVLLEGRYPDVRREAQRLAHAGLRTGRDSVVLVLAPPADEEMVLHEEAIDAAERSRIADLPRAVTLAEPDVVRQRHFDRALGREQDVAALRDRFGAGLVDEVLGRLEASRRVRYRRVWHFDAAADDAASRELVRAAGEAALGEPIRADCVGEAVDRTRLVDRGTSETLREVDAAIAPTLFPPGAIFEHARGRYLVVESGRGVTTCERIVEPHRTTLARRVTVELEGGRFEARELGGAAIEVACSDARIVEEVYAVRRYAPGPELIERRRYERPVRAAYSSEACVVKVPLPREATVPIAAALRMILPCALRASAELVDVAPVTVGEAEALAFFDRTPGSSGFARTVAEGALAELFALARHALERLVGPVSARLHRLHDSTDAPDVGPDGWRVTEALGWLDAVLQPPRGAADDGATGLRRRRVEWSAGEGPGDLGRLWIAATGRTDDLVWTRHRFRSAHPLGGQPAGPVFLDVAIERRTIAWSIRKAQLAGASTQPLSLTTAEAWIPQHSAALSTASDDLAAVHARLARLAGPSHVDTVLVDTVLALVAAIPTHPSPLPVCERAPTAAFARRRADRDAKCLLAWALLPTSVSPTIRLTEQGPVLQIHRRGGEEVVDLSGDAIRSVTGDTGAALALSWGEDAPPEEAAEGDAEA